MRCPINPNLFTDEWNGHTPQVGMFFGCFDDELGGIVAVYRIDSVSPYQMKYTYWNYYNWNRELTGIYRAAFSENDRFLPPLLAEIYNAVQP